MTRAIQVTVDAAGPRALAEFWCQVLGYVEQRPPAGFEDALTAFGIDQSDPDRAFAIVDPDGIGPWVGEQIPHWPYSSHSIVESIDAETPLR